MKFRPIENFPNQHLSTFKVFYTIFIHNVITNSSVVFNTFLIFNFIFYYNPNPSLVPTSSYIPPNSFTQTFLLHTLSPILTPSYLLRISSYSLPPPPPPLPSPRHVQTPNQNGRKVFKNNSRINYSLQNCTLHV